MRECSRSSILYHLPGLPLNIDITSTVHGMVLLRQWLSREAGWRYGIMFTVPYKQQKLYRQIILLLHDRLV